MRRDIKQNTRFSPYNQKREILWKKRTEQINSDEWLKEFAAASGKSGVQDAEEMIVCAKCARTNPPTRLKCFYCGAELEISETQSGFLKPNLRKLEIWEKGFNIIYQSKNENFDEAKLPEIAKMLKLETKILQKILDAQENCCRLRAPKLKKKRKSSAKTLGGIRTENNYFE